MKQLKAIELLRELQSGVIPLDEEILKAIQELTQVIVELEDLQSRSCENCYESKTCKILHFVYKDRLKKEGYAMHKNEFKCGFWHSLF